MSRALDPVALARWLAEQAPGARYWVALSGGLDSTVLLHALARARAQLPGPLAAVHLDHGLQAHSRDWVIACQRRCAALNIPLHSLRARLHVPPGASLEAWARECRYRHFAELLAPGEVLLTAHHQDDQAETMLLALLRGSGVRGLSAMPTLAALGRGQHARPLLALGRAELLAYARAHALHWIEDPSNAQTSFDRNFLRHRLLPLLRTRWPAASATLARSAAHCAEAAGLIEVQAGERLAQLGGSRPGTLDLMGLEDSSRALAKAVIALWLRRSGFTPPPHHHLERVLDELARARPDASPCIAWNGCELRRDRHDLFALAPLPAPPPAWLSDVWTLGPDAERYILPPGLGVLEWHPAPGASVQRLRIGFAHRGLRCRAHSQAPARTLKKLFQSAGVPSWLRAYVPLVFDEDERLLAVLGVGRCCAETGAELRGTLHWRAHPWEAWLGHSSADR